MPLAILNAFAENPLFFVSWLLLGGLVVQAVLHIGGQLGRLHYEKRRGELEQQRLRMEIRAAQSRIATVEQASAGWNGVRKFEVAQKVEECADTFSFYLKPHDGKALPKFRPGQYLTFQLNIPGRGKPVVRCYSLSDCARPTHYRVTIKRCTPPTGTTHPPGVGSSFFADSVKPGDILDVKAPNGHFYLDLERNRPVVLISGGIGITPMISMAHALIETGSTRDIWFFFGARNRADHMFREVMLKLAKHPTLRLHVCYSKPGPTDAKGTDYHHEGRVSVALFKQVLPSSNFDYYLCGPGPFMETITEDLRAWGVPDEWVHFEAFGPASVKRAAKPAVKTDATAAAAPAGVEITFAKSGRTITWSGSHGSLLEMADEHGVKIDAGCRAGNCGSCLVAVKSGEVAYVTSPGAAAEAGSCLTCIGKPKGPLVLDA